MRSLVSVAVLALPAVASSATNCTFGTGWGTADTGAALQVVTLVNEHRASLGLKALSVDANLTAAAVWKSGHMAYYHYFDHYDPAPPVARDPFTRMRDCDAGGGAAENIAAGQATPADVMKSWLSSDGHRRNIEDPTLTKIGVGAVTLQGSPHGIYWTQDFATGPLTTIPNASPVALDDTVSVSAGVTSMLRVLDNDSDPDAGDTLQITAVSASAHGTTARSGTRISYLPDPAYSGPDLFTYRVEDQAGVGATATVFVTVTRQVVVNRPPAARDDSVELDAGQSIDVEVLKNDSDPDADAVSVTGVSGAAHGTVSLVGNVVHYEASVGADSIDRLTYRVTDGRGGTDSATLRVRIAGTPPIDQGGGSQPSPPPVVPPVPDPSSPVVPPLPDPAVATPEPAAARARVDLYRVRTARAYLRVLMNDAGVGLRIRGVVVLGGPAKAAVDRSRRAVRLAVFGRGRIVLRYHAVSATGQHVYGRVVVVRV